VDQCTNGGGEKGSVIPDPRCLIGLDRRGPPCARPNLRPQPRSSWPSRGERLRAFYSLARPGLVRVFGFKDRQATARASRGIKRHLPKIVPAGCSIRSSSIQNALAVLGAEHQS
jgi:hypothetical protein